jgi:hypothetical protein
MNNIKISVAICLIIIFSFKYENAKAQLKVGDNPTTINAGSALEVESTNKGFLFPRVSLSSTTSWSLLGTTAAGMSVYNTNGAITGSAAYPTTGAGLYYFDGTGWVSKNAKGIAILTEPWYNVATNTGASNNTQNIYQLGNVGIGLINPTEKLVVSGGNIKYDGLGNSLFSNSGYSSFGELNSSVDAYMATAVKAAPTGGFIKTAPEAGSFISAQVTDGITFHTNITGSTGAAVPRTTGEVMRIAHSGYIGIGTTTPSAKLETSSALGGFNTQIVRSSGAASNGLYTEQTGGGGNALYANALLNSNAVAAYSISGLAVYGQSTNSYGIYGKTNSASIGAIIGFSANNNVWGIIGHTNQYALYGAGDLFVSGNLAKASGTFKIDHPQDPANKYLIHSFVESPDMMNVYNGNIITDADGNATVNLPDYFLSLNKEFRYQLTAIGTFAQAIIAEEVNTANQFKIKTDKPNVKISWQVTGIRKDPYANEHRIKDVVEKTGEEKGKYIHPDLYNQPAEKGIFYKKPIEIKK